MSGNILLVNATPQESRVALVEQGTLVEFHVERKRERGMVGDVYKARVLRVLPGMQAAFVDIGHDKAAFLYVSDVYNRHEEYMSEVVSVVSDEGSGGSGEDAMIPQSRGRHRPTGPIEERLREGQSILVQVAKEPIGGKGARITSHITLPGRHLVHMPTFDHIGVSRRIEDEDERVRLRELVMALRPAGMGFIVRTASEGLEREHLERDIDYLTRLWREILASYERERAPALLYADLDLITRSARDLFTEEIDELVIDDFHEWQRTRDFVGRFMPALADQVHHYQGSEPIFEAYGVELEIERALGRKVWLKSGGYLVIERTEALTAIDINTGKFVGKHSLEDTILQINLEAVREILYQLRLRNIGGLIIIDFIDMGQAEHRERVSNAIEEGLKKDRAKTNVLKISEFGLVEMTRKRVRESLVQTLCEPCQYCEGKGYTKSRETIAYEILRQLPRALSRPESAGVQIIAHQDVAHLVADEERAYIEALEQRHGKRIDIKAAPDFHVEQYRISER